MTGFLIPNARLTDTHRPPRAEDADLPAVTILTPFYREPAEIFQRSAGMLRHLDYPHHKVSVRWLVDARLPGNAATARAAAARARESFGGDVRVVVVPSMTPKAKALNHVLREVADPFVAIYDADTVPDPGQLRQAVAALRARDLDVVDAIELPEPGGDLVNRTTLAQSAAFFGAMEYVNRRTGMHMLLGSSVYFRREALDKVGPLREDGVEELYEWAVRAASLGVRMGRVVSFSYGTRTSLVGPALRQRTRWIRGQLDIGLRFLRGEPLPARPRAAVALMTLSLLAQLSVLPVVAGAVRHRGLRVPAAALLAGEALRIRQVSRDPVWEVLRVGSGWFFLLPFELMESTSAWRAVWELATGRDTWYKVRAETPDAETETGADPSVADGDGETGPDTGRRDAGRTDAGRTDVGGTNTGRTDTRGTDTGDSA
ncbi:glycosyltransferase family 2 protein [Streptomyces sp. NPDC006368]|uniref:glycosyltransferase family 2 protein n=1 Tax=Streptomyces sp. NPDC006368 TaxID=3156760 RepID=UPI0033A23E8D